MNEIPYFIRTPKQLMEWLIQLAKEWQVYALDPKSRRCKIGQLTTDLNEHGFNLLKEIKSSDTQQMRRLDI